MKMKKSSIAIGTLVVCALFTVVTLAFQKVESNSLTNSFTVAEKKKVYITVNEENPVIEDKNIIKKPTVRNEDGATAIVRVKVSVSPYLETVYNRIDFNENFWSDGGDGYYYYKSKLDSNKETAPVFTQINNVIDGNRGFAEGVEPFEVHVYAEALPITFKYQNNEFKDLVDGDGNINLDKVKKAFNAVNNK